MLLDSRDVYSRHMFDVGKTSQEFHVTLKPKAELKRQRPSKVPLHLKEKKEKFLAQLKDADKNWEMGDDDEMGSLFVNPIILMPENDYVKLIIDAPYLNSVTGLTNYSSPLEPVQIIMTRGNGKIFSFLLCLAPTIKCLWARKLRNLQVLSLVDNNIPTLEVCMVYADSRVSLVDWWQFILIPSSRRSKP